ncbi:hypothetical protein BDV10DRAFT_183588 [Aspergillus recurvatus]
MLRLKPTRISLTEDDLCYHIDSIFHRNHDLAVWHQKRKGSGNSYDGDEDEEGLSQDSNTDTIPETPPESECDEAQSQTLAGDSQQEIERGESNTNANGGASSHEQRPISVRFALPEPSASSSDSNSRVVVRGGKAVIQPAEIAQSLPLSLWLAPFPSTNWNTVIGVSISQHNNPNLNSLRLFLPRQTQVALDTYIASLFSSITALPLRLSRREYEITQPVNSRKSLFPLSRLTHDLWVKLDARAPPAIAFLDTSLPSHSPNIQLVLQRSPPPPEMKRTHRTESACTGNKSHKEKPGEDRITDSKDQVRLSAKAPNSGSAATQLVPPKGLGSSPVQRCLSSPTEKAGRVGRDEDSENVGHLADRNTVSRGTQTDSDLTPTMGPDMDVKSTDNPLVFIVFQQNSPGRQENIAPGKTAERSPNQPVWQDPFISAMFPEPNAPAYDPTNRIRRGMQGYVNPPTTSRASQTRNDRGELVQMVHPTLVDARVYQEYVHRLIAELDRPPTA